MNKRRAALLVSLTAVILVLLTAVIVGVERVGRSAGPADDAPATVVPARDIDTILGAATSAARTSYFADKLSPSGIEAPRFCCTVLTPRRTEIAEPQHLDLRVYPGEDSYAASVRPYARAIGDLALAAGSAPPLAREVARELTVQWSAIRRLAEGAAAEPPLRVFVKHYPRADLPGRCVVVHATFYNVYDRHFDRQRRPGSDRGVLFHVRKTVQLDGAAPRVIEAMIEVHATTGGESGWNLPTGRQLGKERVGAVGLDDQYATHFEDFAAGVRHGLAWYDRAAGAGAADLASFAYRVEDSNVAAVALTGELESALLAFAGRA